MRPLLRVVWLGFGTLAIACADPAPAGNESGDSGTESGESGDGDGDPGDGDGDPGDGDGDPDDGDGDPGDGDGDGPEGPELPPGACMVRGVLADDGYSTAYVYEDGAPVQVIESGLPFAHMLTRGDRIAIAGGEGDFESPYVNVFSRATGELLGEDHVHYGAKLVLIDALDRVYVRSYEFEQYEDGVLFDELGVATTLSKFAPEGALAEGGWIPGRDNSGVGFYRPATHEFEPYSQASPLLFSTGNERGQLELIEAGPPPKFVIAEPDDVVALELPALPSSWARITASVGPWRIAAGFAPSGEVVAQYRVHVETHEVLAIDPEPPVGFTHYPCHEGASLDAAGRVVLPMFDGAVVQVMLWDPSDDSWTPLGRPYTQIGTIQLDHIGSGSLGDVYWLRTLVPASCAAAPDAWAPAPAEAGSGEGGEITRLGATRSFPYEGWAGLSATAIDAAGSCVGLHDSESSYVASFDDELPPVELPARAMSLD